MSAAGDLDPTPADLLARHEEGQRRESGIWAAGATGHTTLNLWVSEQQALDDGCGSSRHRSCQPGLSRPLGGHGGRPALAHQQQEREVVTCRERPVGPARGICFWYFLLHIFMNKLVRGEGGRLITSMGTAKLGDRANLCQNRDV